MGKTIFVTGGTGYIGKSICRELADKGYNLKILYRDEKKIDKNICSENCTFLKGDLLNLKPLEERITSADIVIHLAADIRLESANSSVSKTNITGTENLLKFCSRFNNKFHFIFFSSIEANGPTENKITKISDTPHPLSEYGRSKIAGEDLVKEYSIKYNFNYTILRLGNVYDEKSGWFQHFAHALKEKGGEFKLLYYFTSRHTMHFIHLKEVAKSAASIVFNESAFNKTYFLASESYNIKEILDILSDASNIPRPKIFLKPFWYPVFIISIIRKRDGLIAYICNGGSKRIFRTYDISQSQKDFNFRTQNLFMDLLKNGIDKY